MKKLDQNQYVNVCKLGQGSKCCRYLVAGMEGLECGKLQDGLRKIIDQRVADGQFMAIGDNCEGIAMDNLLDVRYSSEEE